MSPLDLAQGTALPPDILHLLAGIRLVAFDFDGVFTDNTVSVDQNGIESVRCWRGDGLGLDKLRKLGIEMMVISTEANPVVGARCRKLRLPCIQGCDDKLRELRAAMQERGLNPHDVAYMGNDINDAECLAHVGLAVAPADGHPDILPLLQLRTAAPGGRGAVREFCDLVATIRA